jgi:CRISPR-associated protein Csb2
MTDVFGIRCTLLRDTFEGGRARNPTAAEWPPSWMRLFSALVSVAEPGVDDDLLVMLEEADPPCIQAARNAFTTHRSAFVPVNATGNTKHSTLVARTNSEKGWARAIPQHPEIFYTWPDLSLASEQRERLESICRRVPYLGRSTSPALIEIVDETREVEGLDRLIPRSRLSDEAIFVYATTVRCPFPGSLGALRDAHEAKYRRGEAGDPWEIGLGVDYGIERARTEEKITEGPYPTMVLFSMEGHRLDGRHTARVTAALRRALLARAVEHVPVLHGHHGGDVAQVAVLGLPFVGHEQADGHLVGAAIAIPDLSRQELSVVAGALPDVGETIDLTAGPLGVLHLRRISPLDAAREAKTLQPERWSGPARTWVTALPMVLDRFFKPGMNLEDEVRRAVVNSGFPSPEVLRVDRRPMLAGALDLAPHDTLRRRGQKGFKPYRHVKLRFPETVRGPVVIGSMRHYGLGLCVPVPEESTDG